MSRNSDDYLVIAAGTVLGLLAGVAAGIIFSPKPGVEMRQDIKDMAKKAYKDVPTDMEVAKASFNENIDKLKYSFENQLNKINDAIKANKMASAKEKEEMDAGY